MTSESWQKIELRPTDYLKGINFHRIKFSRELIFVETNFRDLAKFAKISSREIFEIRKFAKISPREN